MSDTTISENFTISTGSICVPTSTRDLGHMMSTKYLRKIIVLIKVHFFLSNSHPELRMLSTGSELPKPPLPIRQDLACPSFRVYYGVASGAVPFLWESQPGIPKHTYSSNTLLQPPLSPPPSYFSSTKNKSSKKNTSKKFDFKLSFRRKKLCRPFPFPSPSFSSPVSSASLASTAAPTGSSRCCSRRPVMKYFSCFWNNVDMA